MGFTEEDIELGKEIKDGFKNYFVKMHTVGVDDADGINLEYACLRMARLENENKRLIGIVQNLTNEVTYLRNMQEPLK